MAKNLLARIMMLSSTGSIDLSMLYQSAQSKQLPKRRQPECAAPVIARLLKPLLLSVMAGLA
jgi:hypothetical protein